MKKFLIRFRGYFFKCFLYILGVNRVGFSIRLRNFPIITIRDKGKINIGNNVVLNSRNRGYHVNMYSPIKLMVKEGGVIEIGDNSRIHGTCIHAKKKVTIGKNCLIAANTQIMDSNSHEIALENPESRLTKKDFPKEIVIEDNVWIGCNVIILPGINIGEGSVVAAGSVVVKSVPKFSVVGGNPAKVIKTL